MQLGHLALLAGLAVVGCGADEASTGLPIAQGTYIGVVDGSDARVGVVVGPTSTVAFVCGGPTSVSTATTWLRGATAPRGTTTLASDGRTASVQASGEGRLVATVEGAATPLRFTASRVADGAIAGLYEGSDDQGRAGVVVTSADEAQGAFVRATDGVTFQVIVIRPLALDQGALRAKVEGRELLVRRLVAR